MITFRNRKIKHEFLHFIFPQRTGWSMRIYLLSTTNIVFCRCLLLTGIRPSQHRYNTIGYYEPNVFTQAGRPAISYFRHTMLAPHKVDENRRARQQTIPTLYPPSSPKSPNSYLFYPRGLCIAETASHARVGYSRPVEPVQVAEDFKYL